MIPDTLPHPTRSSITTLRILFDTGSAPGRCRQQLTIATGILGAITGFLFGNANKRASHATVKRQDSHTVKNSPLPCGAQWRVFVKGDILIEAKRETSIHEYYNNDS